MANTLNARQIEDVWYELAKAYAGQDFDRDKLSVCDQEQLKAIFFQDVAPYCAPFLLSITPTVYEGFFRDELIPGIRAFQERGRNAFLARFWQKIQALWYNSTFKEGWERIAPALERIRTNEERR